MGKWREVRFFSRSIGCRQETILVVQDDLNYNQKYIRKNNRGYSEHNSVRNNRWNGKTLGRIWLNLGSLRINIRFRAYAYRSRC